MASGGAVTVFLVGMEKDAKITHGVAFSQVLSDLFVNGIRHFVKTFPASKSHHCAQTKDYVFS